MEREGVEVAALLNPPRNKIEHTKINAQRIKMHLFLSYQNWKNRNTL
jgi:hypothetical protein